MDVQRQLALIWENIEFFRKLSGLPKGDVYRADRYGKGLSLTTLLEIAEALEVPVSVLLETVEDRELTIKIAWGIVCKELGMSEKEIRASKKMASDIEKIIKEYRKNG